VTRRSLAGAYALTFLTGAAGLIYQIAWQKYLVRLLGSDRLATATVLGVFLAGLSAGYVVCGRLSERSRDPFRTYGLLEGAIGVWALVFPWLFAAVDALGVPAPVAASARVVWALFHAALLVLVPTLCMGGTVPLLTRALSTSVEGATGVHARIYAINSAGACVGTLAAGFVLIYRLGLPGTLRFAALLNLVAAAYFVRAGGRAPAAPRQRASAPARGAAAQGPPSAWLHAIVFVAGFYFMTLETVLVRFTHLTLGSSSYSLALVVAACIACIAAGAWAVGRRAKIGPAALLWNQAAACVGLMLLFPGLDEWPYYAHLLRLAMPDGLGGFVLFHLAAFVALVAMLILPVGCMGATLPLAFHAAKRGLDDVGMRAGAIFGWNAAGNLIGGIGGGFLVYRWLNNGEVFLLALGLCAFGAVLATAWLPRAARLRAAALAVAVGGFCVWFPGHDPLRFAVGTFRLREPLDYSHAGPDEFFRQYYRTRRVLAYRDDPEGTFAVVENPLPTEALAEWFPALAASIWADPATAPGAGPRPRSILVNGKSDSSTYWDRETLKLSAHLPALFGPRRGRALVIGLGTGVTAGELALYPDVHTIDVVEIAPGVVELLPMFADWTGHVDKDPRLKLRVADAFQVLRERGPAWDIVVSEPSNPWTSGVDQLFSREFYRLVRRRLAPDGMLLQWLQRYATTPEIDAIVIGTLRAEFPYVRVFRAGGDDLLLASATPFGADALERAAAELRDNAAVRASLEEIGIASVADLRARLHPDVLERAAALAAVGQETLDRPRIHYLAGLAAFTGAPPPDEPAGTAGASDPGR